MFSDGCESKVFPTMKRTKKKSVIVLDRATCHTFLDKEDKRLVMSWRKGRLANYIARLEGISEDWTLTWRVKKTKNELQERAKEIIRCVHKRFKIMLRSLMRMTSKSKFYFFLSSSPNSTLLRWYGQKNEK